MQLGRVLYRHMLNRRNVDFARQAGATHLIVHLTDHFAGKGFKHSRVDQPIGGFTGSGLAGDPERLWSVAELNRLKSEANAAGLELAALENIDPAFWHDVLLDGPQRDKKWQCSDLDSQLGQVGIPVLGYNFSLAAR